MTNVVDAKKIHELKEKMNQIQIENLMEEVNNAKFAGNLPELRQKLEELRHTMNEKTYKESNEVAVFLENATDALKLMEKIEKAWKRFNIPFVPNSLPSLQTSLLYIHKLKEKSLKFDGAFTAEDEKRLKKTIKDVQDLEAKYLGKSDRGISIQVVNSNSSIAILGVLVAIAAIMLFFLLVNNKKCCG